MVIKMDDNERDILKHLTEAEARAKSNTKQIEEIKRDIEKIHEENKALYTLTTSVELIAQEMTTTKDLIQNMDEQLSNVSDKVEAMERKPYEEYLKAKGEIKTKVIVSVVSMVMISLISVLGTLVFTNLH